jgi:hypothetical protein
MSEFGLIDRLRTRVFVVDLPGMTARHQRCLIRRCHRLAWSAAKAGIPLGVVWCQITEFADRAARRLRTEHERETFVAIMQRLRNELFQECGCLSR